MATLDQSFTGGTSLYSVGGNANAKYLGQTLTCGTIPSGQKLVQIDLQLQKYGTGGDDFSVALYNSSDTLVSDVIIFEPSTLSDSSSSWITFVFSTAPDISTGDVIKISIGRETVDSSNFLYIGYQNSDGYAGGRAYYGASTPPTTTLSTWDFNFKTYYDVLPTGWTGDSYMGVSSANIDEVDGVETANIDTINTI